MEKTVVITGANGGIGYELSRQYKSQNWNVIAACRSASADLKALGVTIVEGVDVTSDEGIKNLSNAVENEKIHILINNAGVFQNESLEEMNFDQIRNQIDINSLGPLRVTMALLSHLVPGSKLVFISSRMGSIADNDSGKFYGYRSSKAALNAMAKSLSIDLKPRDITVATLHPGYVQTKMTNFSGDVTAKDSAAGLIKRIEEATLERTGRFVHAQGEELPW